MRIFGFSTGSLAKHDFRRGLAMLKKHELKAVELSALRESELKPLLASLDELFLADFVHVSLHAPSKLVEFTEQELCDLLLPVCAKGWPIIVHPDVIKDPQIWRRLGTYLCVENMDKRKPVGRTAHELAVVFERVPEARLCLDVGHAKQIDPTWFETRQILRFHGTRLTQVHLSDVNSNCDHEALNQLAIMEFQKIAHLLPEDVPVILESPIRESEIGIEIDRARRALNVLSELLNR